MFILILISITIINIVILPVLHKKVSESSLPVLGFIYYPQQKLYINELTVLFTTIR